MPLYCERHTAAVYDRGGRNRLGVIDNLAAVSWERVRDDMSIGEVTSAYPSAECLNILGQVRANRHELVIFRGSERVWEGPISLITRTADSVNIQARDIGYYLYRTVAHARYDNGGALSTPVVDRAVTMITAELARKEALDPPINVVPFISTVRAPDTSWERRTYRDTLPYGITVFDDLDSMAANGGLDYTIVGRRIILNDTRVAIGQTAIVTNDDFIGDLSVKSYGLDFATRAFTTGDGGMYGSAGGIDPYYGEWEIIEDMFDKDTEDVPTQLSLDNAAGYNLIGKQPLPTVISVPENSRLNPDGVLSMKDLIPGVIVPVKADMVGVSISEMQKLNSVKVTESADEGEVITIALGAAPRGLDPPGP